MKIPAVRVQTLICQGRAWSDGAKSGMEREGIAYGTIKYPEGVNRGPGLVASAEVSFALTEEELDALEELLSRIESRLHSAGE